MVSETTPAARRWMALAVLVLPVLVISMDATILGFAVPQLSETLEPSSSQLLWIIDVYSFVLAGLLVTMGRLGDLIGRRKLLLVGVAGFSAASAIAAFSTSAEMLIGARALLGLAGATLMPSTLSLIRNVFPDDRERQVAIAVWSAVFALGAAAGPIVGGFLLEHFWWGSVFLVTIPITMATLIFAPNLVPESKDPNPGRFDLVSSALSMVTMIPIVYGIKITAEHGISVAAIASLIVGVVAGVMFVRRQRGSADPMIDIALFRLRGFRTAVGGNLVACFGIAGLLYFTTQYLQLVVGFSPLRAGLQLLPAILASVVAIAVSPRLGQRFGAFAVIAVGLAGGATGFVMLSQVSATGDALLAAIAVFVVYSGLGAAMTVAVDGVIASVPPHRAGAGASVSETANELGVALGTALLGSVATAVYRPRVDELVGIPAEALAHARETLGAAAITAEHLPDTVGYALLSGAQRAFVDGLSVASWIAAGALAAAATWATMTHRRGAGSTSGTTGGDTVHASTTTGSAH